MPLLFGVRISMKPLHYFGRVSMILVSLCIFVSLSVSQTPPAADTATPTATPLEVTKSVESNPTKPSQTAVDIATVGGAFSGSWPWAIVILAVVIIIWLRKDLKALINRLATTISSVKVGGVELQASATLPETPPDVLSSIENETEKPQSEYPKDSIESLEELDSENEISQTEDSKGWLDRVIEISRGSRDADEMKSVFDAAQAIETEPHQRLVNEILYYYFRFRAGDAGAIEGLKALTENPEVKSDAYKWLSACYALADNYPKTIEALEHSIESASDETIKSNLVVSLAGTLYKNGETKRAISRIFKAIQDTSIPQGKSILYKSVADLYKKQDNKELRALALEKAVEFTDVDTDLLFSLAYAYSENGEDGLSLQIYRRLLDLEPANSSALNNLGVQYSNLKLPISSVEVYKVSVELGNTLASSNLAVKMLEIGLVDEAQQVLTAAKSADVIHQNVLRAEADIIEKREAEANRKEEIISRANKQRQFLRAYAEAYFLDSQPADLTGKWKFGPDDFVWEPIGEFIHKKDILFNERIEGVFNDESRKFRVEIHNRALEIRMMKEESATYSKDLVWRDSGDEGKAYMSSDGTTISVMMDTESDSQFWEIVKLTPEEIANLPKKETA
jgi:tetratricopeptide (TPR) repeat protein